MSAIEQSADYLASDAALASIARDPYWPKWDSPWWHMRLLYELGEAPRIPARTAEHMAGAVDRLLHIFPIDPGDAPGADPHRDISCHCALGTMTSVLTACGIEVDAALPWVRPWFARYQLADGGLSCDEAAYRVAGESPSSIVATVAALEALVILEPHGEAAERAARNLIERALVEGSPTAHNASEREAATAWRALTFPRFYFYDVLRGAVALADWAVRTGRPMPLAVQAVHDELEARFPDGVLRVERNAHAGKTTIVPTADRSPSPRVPASSFPLLDEVSAIGAPAPALTRQWTELRTRLAP